MARMGRIEVQRKRTQQALGSGIIRPAGCSYQSLAINYQVARRGLSGCVICGNRLGRGVRRGSDLARGEGVAVGVAVGVGLGGLGTA
jgi:hypothetical protein